jgi:hypothetical protein
MILVSLTGRQEARRDATCSPEALHAFCTERAYERIAAAGARHDSAGVAEYWRGVWAVDVLYADARRRQAVDDRLCDYLRRIAMRDQDHAEYRPEWTMNLRRGRLRALRPTAGMARLVFSRDRAG